MESMNDSGWPVSTDVLECARRVLRIESDAVAALIGKVGPAFERAVEIILNCKGRVIVTGIGKSGIVATKIAATLTSTGTAALFLHPSEGMHGDLGLVLKDDVVICISKSGNTGEITRLFPIFRHIGVPIITLTGNLRSALAERSDVVLDVSVTTEACPNNLAPTASTTAALAMGDALAVALLEKRNFKPEDFAFLHPGGSLGKKLISISDLMFTGDKIPKVHLNVKLREVILEITRKRFGGTCIVDDDGRLVGIITDGDLRRLMQKPFDFDGLYARDIMNPHPQVVREGSSAAKALELLKNYNIMQIVVVDQVNRPVGMVHLHDLLEAGIEKK
jgi:arabinose-5-phosphate isomerase